MNSSIRNWTLATAAAALVALPPISQARAGIEANAAQAGALNARSSLCLLPNPPAGLCTAPSPQTGATSQSPSPAGVHGFPAWTIAPSPNLRGGLDNDLAAVACPATSDCWAVGEQIVFGTDLPLLERWNGMAWRIVAVPAPANAQNTTLDSLTCVSDSDCWIGGYFSVQGGGGSVPLAEHWNGSGWSLVQPPSPTGAVSAGLNGVACAAASDCWAVGFDYNSGNFGSLIERWDGTSWSIVPGASAGTGDSRLSGVTCAAASECWAVGSSTASSGGNQALVERWDGTAWSLTSAALPTLAGSDQLSAVVCASAASCWAVGQYSLEAGCSGTACPTATSQALIEEWSGGGSWTVDNPTDASPLSAAALAQVTCVSASECYSAGWSQPAGGSSSTLIDVFNGSAWSSEPTSASTGAKNSSLSGVACGGAACWAVGAQTVGSFNTSLVDRIATGSWNAGATPVPQGEQTNGLSGVACAAGPRCFAVGAHSSKDQLHTLIESWSGGGWSVVPSPSAGGGLLSNLNAVSCASATDCWAVGNVQTNASNGQPPSSSKTLTEHWNGQGWSIVGSPNPTKAQLSALLSVSCVSASDCWAVGFSYPFANAGVTEGHTSTGPIAIAQTLIEQWNGESWSIVSSPNVNLAMSDELTSISCVSATDCWAVGAAEGTQTVQGLVEHWNGTAWSIVTSPQTTGNESNVLFGVACASATSCWSVGYSYPDYGYTTWVEHWNGRGWSVAYSPNVGGDHVDALFAVTCASVHDCRAVGAYGDGPVYVTLALQYDGNVWDPVSSEDPAVQPPPNDGPFLYAVTCTTVAICWSAGNFNDTNGTLQTLIEDSASLPGAPTNVTAVPGYTTSSTGPLTVSFRAVISDGSPISGYSARCTSSNGGTTRSASAASSPITVTGLTTGSTYTCTARATNGVGTGPASMPSLAVIVGSPAAPTSVAATRVAAGELRVSFASGADNGSPITSYTASCSSGNGGISGTSSGPAGPLTVSGLTAGKAYSCTVQASNARGSSLASSPSKSVTA